MQAVHPRGYGEHLSVSKSSVTFAGSSPWVRGTSINIIEQRIEVRFIPVGTGNMLHPSSCDDLRAVHPRGYGEHARPSLLQGSRRGSSPWVRGTFRLL